MFSRQVFGTIDVRGPDFGVRGFFAVFAWMLGQDLSIQYRLSDAVFLD
jgi:hypothetical protein